MRVIEFKQMTDAQLLQMADDCLAQMGPAPKGLRGINEYPALLLQAQLYMNEVDRRVVLPANLDSQGLVL